ncbi:sft2 [Symbiodinium microadriaticum]|nr:sft2 [Symbiodinium microadriaticum]CAE7939141.1 sft2 [Symbiodinium sp. KB8]
MRGEQDGDWRGTLNSFARRARAALAPTDSESLTVPLASRPADGAQTDAEMQDRLGAWARQAQQGFTQGLQHARTIDWAEQVHAARSSVSSSFEKVSSSASAAGATLQERMSQGVERAKSVDWSAGAEAVKSGASRSLQSVASTASSSAANIQERISDSNVIQNARQGAVSALSVASERVQGAASLAMDPCRLWRFVAMFASGLFLVLFSLNFWLMPATFSLLSTIGSILMLASFVYLSGWRAFLEQISQRRKLPYAIAYVTGLLGTLWATLIRRSHLLTALFGVVQLVSLLYFIAAHFPGGTATLNMLGRFGGRSARSLIVG